MVRVLAQCAATAPEGINDSQRLHTRLEHFQLFSYDVFVVISKFLNLQLFYFLKTG